MQCPGNCLIWWMFILPIQFFSPDGQQIAFSYQNSIQILDLESDEIIGQYEADSSVFLSPIHQLVRRLLLLRRSVEDLELHTGKSWVLEDSKHAHHCRLQGVVESDDIQYTRTVSIFDHP